MSTSTTTQCDEGCHFGDHDEQPLTPTVTGEWSHDERRRAAQEIVNQIPVGAWTFCSPGWIQGLIETALKNRDAERDVVQTLATELATQAEQRASTLARVVGERDRLREALQQAREFICVQTWPVDKPRTADAARRREAEGLIVRIDAVLTTTIEQEQRG